MPAAFGAPIGGVTFAIEQVSSFYSPNMLWHAAVAAGIALYVTLVWMGTDVDPGAHSALAWPPLFLLCVWTDGLDASRLGLGLERAGGPLTAHRTACPLLQDYEVQCRESGNHIPLLVSILMPKSAQVVRMKQRRENTNHPFHASCKITENHCAFVS